MIIQISGAMLVGSISFVPMIHYPVITIDAQDADGKKVVLHLVEEDGE